MTASEQDGLDALGEAAHGGGVSAWLAVVSAENVRRAVALGIAQIGHGKRANLSRMHAGDTLIFYSPVQRLGDRIPLRHFTALGEIADDGIWQADEGDFKPFRRRVNYADAAPVELGSVRDQLHLTAGRNSGYQLRRGCVPLDAHDVNVLRFAMARSR
ncbi:EVE domain-containing protein [Arthrobacter sp. ISL-5]|uniref:EVE domain-containing protein n=1 Tax=Arthrobacter sp. ISL-5 TaxID=2819111 RepID=UPI002034F545|nr:EVE domain-containing protein [Arthrobacter sp. ISL-5]